MSSRRSILSKLKRKESFVIMVLFAVSNFALTHLPKRKFLSFRVAPFRYLNGELMSVKSLLRLSCARMKCEIEIKSSVQVRYFFIPKETCFIRIYEKDKKSK